MNKYIKYINKKNQCMFLFLMKKKDILSAVILGRNIQNEMFNNNFLKTNKCSDYSVASDIFKLKCTS